jgi:uncharacterized membrane protein
MATVEMGGSERRRSGEGGPRESRSVTPLGSASGAPPTGEEPREHQLEFARIVAFSDGVMAIAITLLVLNIDVPELPDDRAYQLADELYQLAPTLLAYALSFAVIGRFWMGHHRFFGTLYGFDAGLIALNLAYLAFVVLIPFTTDLVDSYSSEPAAPISYAVNLGCAALVNWLMMRYALNRGLIRQRYRAMIEEHGRRRALITPVLFAVSIPVALVSPAFAELIWVGILLPRGWPGGMRRLVARRRGDESLA